jgi:hypothetical protein
VTTAVYLLNRSPTRSVEGMTPYEAWHDKKPSVAHLRTFGCIVHVKNTKPMLKKLDDRSIKMVFLAMNQGPRLIVPTIHGQGMSRSPEMWSLINLLSGTRAGTLKHVPSSSHLKWRPSAPPSTS